MTGSYSGLKDKNGKEIHFGQELNICFTSGSGEFIHDCIYTASRGVLGDLRFDFKDLLWVDNGHNQYPMGSTLCMEYGRLKCIYDNDRFYLTAPDEYSSSVIEERQFPFNEEEVLSFNSRYFVVVDDGDFKESK